MVDVERDKKIFVKRCAQCPTIEKGHKHKTGPNPQVCLGRRQGGHWILLHRQQQE